MNHPPTVFHDGRHYRRAVVMAYSVRLPDGRVVEVSIPPKACPDCEGDGRQWDAKNDKFLAEKCSTCGGSGYDPRDVKVKMALAEYQNFEGGVDRRVLADARGVVDMDATRDAAVVKVRGDLASGKLSPEEAAKARAWLTRQGAMATMAQPGELKVGDEVEDSTGYRGRVESIRGDVIEVRGDQRSSVRSATITDMISKWRKVGSQGAMATMATNFDVKVGDTVEWVDGGRQYRGRVTAVASNKTTVTVDSNGAVETIAADDVVAVNGRRV